MSWRARRVNGVVQYSAVRPPTPQQAVDELVGLDGGDLAWGYAFAHETRPADGGDFSSGDPVLLPLARIADGGEP